MSLIDRLQAALLLLYAIGTHGVATSYLGPDLRKLLYETLEQI